MNCLAVWRLAYGHAGQGNRDLAQAFIDEGADVKEGTSF